MPRMKTKMNRREFLRMSAVAAGVMSSARTMAAVNPPADPLRKMIPSSGEMIPVIGMGSWQTFHVGDNPDDRARCVEILRVFFERGGGMIDSSPMYGSSEEVIGHCLAELDAPEGLFSATKVWTPFLVRGKTQIENSFRLWGAERLDLYQVHNLVDWEEHLETLGGMKDEGRIRYVGVTTSHGRRHSEIETLLKTRELDFVQLTYNLRHREAERRLLPLARERGVAVIANRPYDRGGLFDELEGRPVPEWAVEAGMTDWPQFLLKFAVSHPAVTCAIPATSQVQHMRENMAAGLGELPDAKLREKMIRWRDDNL